MNSARRIFAALAVVLALCVAPAANAKVDYSMNAAGGDYAPAANPKVDYSMNAAGGFYAPAAAPKADANAVGRLYTQQKAEAPVASTDSDFSWGSAALGAGAALAVVLLVSGGRSRLGTLRSGRQAA